MTQRCRAITVGLLVVVLALTLLPETLLAEDGPYRATQAKWSELPPLPDPIGFGGPFVGVIEDALIVAGGANFPDGPPWPVGNRPAGVKRWHDRIFVLNKGAAAWEVADASLPAPRAYGGVIPIESGLLLLGGSDADQVFDTVWRMRRTAATGAIQIDEIGRLPEPTAFLGVGRIGDTIFVLPGKRSKEGTDLATGLWTATWSDESLSEWRRLPGPPTGPRQKAVVAVQSKGGRDVLHVFSGEVPRPNPAGGSPTLDYLMESWAFYPEGNGHPSEGDGTWRALAPVPRPIAAGCALAAGDAHILCFSGSTGDHVTAPVQDRPEFPARVLSYHTITDTWIDAWSMPHGVVTTSAVRWNDQIVIPTGEVRPGVRTTSVGTLTIERPPAAFGWINYTVLVVYLLALIAVGVYLARREKSTADFFTAGGRIPWWAAGLSIYATQLSAITYVAIPALAFATDWLVYPPFLMILLLAPIVVTFYLPFFRRLDLTSAYEYLEYRFDVSVRMVGSASFIAFQVFRMAIVVFLPALALSSITGFSVVTSILIMGVLATVYTVLGGIEAVVWTDVIQGFVLLGGVLVSLWIIGNDEGGWSEVLAVANDHEKLRLFDWRFDFVEMSSWGILIGAFALNFGPYTTDQAVIQRYLTTRDEKSAARGIWLNGVASVAFGVLFFLLGAGLFVYFKNHDLLLPLGMRNDEVFPIFVAERLPVGLSGLVIAGIFAASMSSLDSSMHSISTAFTTDFYRRFVPDRSDHDYLKVARIVTVAMGVVGTGTAIVLASTEIRSQFLFFQKVLGLLTSGLVGVFALGIFTERAHARGVLIGIATSVGALVWLNWFSDVNFYWHAVVGSTTCIVVGYLASRVLSGSTAPEGSTYRTRIAKSAVEE